MSDMFTAPSEPAQHTGPKLAPKLTPKLTEALPEALLHHWEQIRSGLRRDIGARVLEWANFLTSMGYALNCTDGSLSTCPVPVCTVLQPDMNQPDYCPVPAVGASPDGFNQFGRAMIRRFADGTPVVRPDPAIHDWNATGTGLVAVAPCYPDPTAGNKPLNGCTPLIVGKNHWAHALIGYKSVPDYMRQAGIEFGVFDAHELGLYP